MTMSAFTTIRSMIQSEGIEREESFILWAIDSIAAEEDCHCQDLDEHAEYLMDVGREVFIDKVLDFLGVDTREDGTLFDMDLETRS